MGWNAADTGSLFRRLFAGRVQVAVAGEQSLPSLGVVDAQAASHDDAAVEELDASPCVLDVLELDVHEAAELAGAAVDRHADLANLGYFAEELVEVNVGHLVR